jgi:hypothetical protein
MGKSRVLRMVNTMMILIVAMIGPMEFSAKILRKKLIAATVIIARQAKRNAATYLHKTSDDKICVA